MDTIGTTDEHNIKKKVYCLNPIATAVTSVGKSPASSSSFNGNMTSARPIQHAHACSCFAGTVHTHDQADGIIDYNSPMPSVSLSHAILLSSNQRVTILDCLGLSYFKVFTIFITPLRTVYRLVVCGSQCSSTSYSLDMLEKFTVCFGHFTSKEMEIPPYAISEAQEHDKCTQTRGPIFLDYFLPA